MKKYVIPALLLLGCIGCVKEADFYEEPQENERKDFSLFNEITVKSNLAPNTYCLVFTSYPYKNGDLVGEPVLTAYAPFQERINIPKNVEKLYVYTNGLLREYANEDITLNPSTGNVPFSRAESGETQQPGDHTWISLSDAFVTAIYDYYPEANPNIQGEDLKISTDLVAPDGQKSVTVKDGVTIIEEWGKTRVWITYVGNGGSNFAGDLWYYTYRVNENKVPVTPLSEIENNLVQIFNRAAPGNKAPLDGTGKRVYLGEFEPGTRIGFKYFGNATLNGQPYPKYSTPYYNNAAYGHLSRQNNATCGVIRSWEYNGSTYATLGMENRLPSESSWDDDFNDMICLIEADPLFVENRIDPPKPNPITIKWKGYWLFEDNYPRAGDYDFNDLVVKYAITETKGKPTIIDLQFVAKGANFNNSFGINGKIYYENLNGYMNVYESMEAEEPITKQITLDYATKYTPMLFNGTHSFDLNSYYENEEDFPCVLSIPITEDSKFLWCLETTPIDVAYPRYQDWVQSGCKLYADWYTDTPVAGTVWNK